MKADIISIGDEILNGQTINTNASWMAIELNNIGIQIRHVISISDNKEDIIETIDKSLKKVDFILITGGLGPTSDDLTRDVLAEFFKTKLIFDQKVLDNIERIFSARNREMNEHTKDLAMVPKTAKTLYNDMGTAPGALYHIDNQVVVSMPGVPYEMKAMMNKDVLPYLRNNFHLPFILHKHILTAGAGESQISEQLVDFEKQLPSFVKLAYLPGLATVKLRLTAMGSNHAMLEEAIQEQSDKLVSILGKMVYGFDNDTLENKIGEILMLKNLRLSVAESCTGGYLGHLITSVSGSSQYFLGGAITYSNDLKMNLLGVKKETLDSQGAVSEQTVHEMIEGSLRVIGSDISIAISGVAGPSGGSEEKPVGTVYVGVGNRDKKYIRKYQFTKDREKNIQFSAVVALIMLRKFLLNDL
jgi:nicotinamide-nucleotide amidase